jgi:flagellar motor switch protein FliN/FliY
MSTETDQPIEDQQGPATTNSVAADSPTDTGVPSSGDEPTIESPEFQEFDGVAATNTPGDLKRIQKIQITVSAELGRAEVPIQQLMSLAEGSVVELNRDIDSPVELYAQGVALASGEVLVVDGHFAIRILNVYDNK